jgi:secreted Zn-dependent insulinase-like peptidase
MDIVRIAAENNDICVEYSSGEILSLIIHSEHHAKEACRMINELYKFIKDHSVYRDLKINNTYSDFKKGKIITINDQKSDRNGKFEVTSVKPNKNGGVTLKLKDVE